MTKEELDLKDAIKRDMGEISWTELKVQCPLDSMVYVSSELELIEVAVAVAEDNNSQVVNWLESGLLQKVDEKVSATWDQSQPRFLGAFVSPFALLQEQSD